MVKERITIVAHTYEMQKCLASKSSFDSATMCTSEC